MNIEVPKSNFPEIHTINDILKHVKDNKAIINFKNKNGCQVLVYQIQSTETFNNEYALECRGITFDKNGKIIGRPLHKFFNLGENESLSISKIDWNQAVALYDKLDGSMITAHRVNGKVSFKSKMSFTSDVVNEVSKYINSNPNIADFCNEIIDEFTPIFEFTSPNNKIVLNYKDTNLTLLHVRHITSGAYISLKDKVLNDLINKYNIKINKPLDFPKNNEGVLNIKEVVDLLKNKLVDKEGFVIVFKDGNMIKAKSTWYHKLHKISTFLRIRDIVDLILDERLDDVKSLLSINGSNIKEIENIQKEVEARILSIKSEVEHIYNIYKNETDEKTFKENKNNPYISLIMYRKKGVDNINYIDFFRKKYLKTYPLDIINTNHYK